MTLSRLDVNIMNRTRSRCDLLTFFSIHHNHHTTSLPLFNPPYIQHTFSIHDLKTAITIHRTHVSLNTPKSTQTTDPTAQSTYHINPSDRSIQSSYPFVQPLSQPKPPLSFLTFRVIHCIDSTRPFVMVRSSHYE